MVASGAAVTRAEVPAWKTSTCFMHSSCASRKYLQDVTAVQETTAQKYWITYVAKTTLGP